MAPVTRSRTGGGAPPQTDRPARAPSLAVPFARTRDCVPIAHPHRRWAPRGRRSLKLLFVAYRFVCLGVPREGGSRNPHPTCRDCVSAASAVQSASCDLWAAVVEDVLIGGRLLSEGRLPLVQRDTSVGRLPGGRPANRAGRNLPAPGNMSHGPTQLQYAGLSGRPGILHFLSAASWRPCNVTAR